MDARRVAGWLCMGAGAFFGLIFLYGLVLGVPDRALFVPTFLMSLLFPIALVLALLVGGWRLARARPAPAFPPRARPDPVPVPGVADVAALPRPIAACPECGYLGLRMPQMGDGLWPGGGETGDRMVCARCQWQGLPARFEHGEDYVAFVRELHEGRASVEPPVA